MLDDLTQAIPRKPDEETPERRRRYVRNGVAMIEGITAAMRSICLADADQGIVDFDPGEVGILRGYRYELDDEGGVRTIPDKQKLVRTVRFSFAALGRSYDIPFSVEVDGNGWRCFRKTVVVRNRLVHPKTPEDLAVTDMEIEEASVAFRWFLDQTRRFGDMVRASAGISERPNEYRSVVYSTDSTDKKAGKPPQGRKSL